MECNYSKAVAIMLNGCSIGAITDITPVSIDSNVYRKAQTRLNPAMEAWAVNLENERGFSRFGILVREYGLGVKINKF